MPVRYSLGECRKIGQRAEAGPRLAVRDAPAKQTGPWRRVGAFTHHMALVVVLEDVAL